LGGVLKYEIMGRGGRRPYYSTEIGGKDVGYQNVTLWVPNIGTITSPWWMEA